ncbi:MAG: DUF3108 domain-containing protein [Saprospiraceae bacterium]
MNLLYKIRILVFLSIVLLTGSATVSDDFILLDQCGISNSTFTNGETLTYKIYYNWGLLWVPAGEVVFSVGENDQSYEMKAHGKTYRSYEKIFRVNDYFYSKTSKETLLPTNFVRIVEEGNYRLYDSVYFDQTKNVAVSYHGKTKETARPQVHRLNHCMQDLMSNLYYMRNINTNQMQRGDKIPISMFFDKEVFPMNVTFGGKEQRDIKELGEFNTLKMVPDLVGGNVFKKGDHMTIWVSDDQNKIPLMIESPISIGSVKAVLKSHRGLRHTLSARINE